MPRSALAVPVVVLLAVSVAPTRTPSDAEIEACVRVGGSLAACSEDPRTTAIEACVRAGGSLTECRENPLDEPSRPAPQTRVGSASHEDVWPVPDAWTRKDDTFPEVAHLGDLSALATPGTCTWGKSSLTIDFRGELAYLNDVMFSTPTVSVLTSSNETLQRVRTSTATEQITDAGERSARRSDLESISALGGLVTLYSKGRTSSHYLGSNEYGNGVDRSESVPTHVEVEGSLFPLETGNVITVRVRSKGTSTSWKFDTNNEWESTGVTRVEVLGRATESLDGVPADAEMWRIAVERSGSAFSEPVVAQHLLRADTGCMLHLPNSSSRDAKYVTRTWFGPAGVAAYEPVLRDHSAYYEAAVERIRAEAPGFLAGVAADDCKGKCRDLYDEFGDCFDDESDACILEFCNGSRVECRSYETIDNCDEAALQVCTDRDKVCQAACDADPDAGFGPARDRADAAIRMEGNQQGRLNRSARLGQALDAIRQNLTFDDPGAATDGTSSGAGAGGSDQEKVAAVKRCHEQKCGNLTKGCKQRGSQRDCHLASACYCQCALDIDPQNPDAAQFRKCIQEGNAKAKQFGG